MTTGTPYDKEKAVADAIEATSGVLKSVKRQRERMESDMERMAQAHDDLIKIEGWVKRELRQYVELKQSYDKEKNGG